MQKVSFRAVKDHLLRAKRRLFGKPEKTALCNGSSLPPKNAAMISAEISDGKKQKQHKPRQHLPAATKRNTAGEKGGSTDENPHGENMRRKGRKTPQAEKPCGSAAGKQGIRNAIPHTYNIYSAQRAENSEQEIILV